MNNFIERVENLSLKQNDINRCLTNLCVLDLLNYDQIVYLANAYNNSRETQICLSLVIDSILAEIKKGTLKRWDFDPFDIYHRSYVDFAYPDDEDLEKLHFTKKCKAISLIADTFYFRCRRMIEEYQTKLIAAKDFQQVEELREDVLNIGILEFVKGKLQHNHSIPHSKKVFMDLNQAIKRVPKAF